MMAGEGQFFLLALLLSLLVFGCGYPLQILGLFPNQDVSNFQFFHPIMRGLAEKGHHVTVISPYPDKSPPAHYRDFTLTNIPTVNMSMESKLLENRRVYNHFVEFFSQHERGTEACNYTLRSEALAEVLHERMRYDVIIMEQFNSDCMMGVAHQLQAPVIALSSRGLMPWHYDRFASPIIPALTSIDQANILNIGSRIGNWIIFHGMRLLYSDIFSTPAADALVRYKFGQDTPSVADLSKDTSLIFINQHFSLTGAKPLPPSVIELAGIHIQKATPLEIVLRRFVDNAEHGVIVINWGRMLHTHSLSPMKRDAILRAIKRVKQRVVWKWEDEMLRNKPDNLYISKGLPQRDILCHPNVKLFITHASHMSNIEATYCGVPVIATPQHGDQFQNAETMKRRGMGLVLHYEDITENKLMKSIREALKQEYADNAKAISQNFKHRPQSALQTAIWWVEYVANTEGAPLIKSTAVYMTRFQYFSLDIYVVLVVGLAIFMSSCSWTFEKFCRKDRKLKKI